MKRDFARPLLGLLAVGLAVCAPGFAARAETKCKLRKVAELPVVMSGMRALVTLKVNGMDTPFVLDSGAWFSMASEAAASRLKLKIEPEASIPLMGVGGMTFAGVGTAKEITFVGVPIRNVQFLVGGGNYGEGSAGLLGQNFLHMFDVEYDLANGVVRLFLPKDCRDVGLAYWAGDTAPSIMPIQNSNEVSPHTIARAQLNGKKIKILFDTGADSSILDKDAAKKAGVPTDEGVEAGGVSGGIGKGLVETWVAPITSLDLGDEQIRRTRLRVGKIGLDGSDMLMGMDFFLSHRILVSNTQSQMYFTYNGGPVFNIGRSSAKSARGTAVAAGGDDKLSASELSRRAKASLSRQDAPAAIADLTRAAKLEPENPLHLSDRARAHMLAGDRDKALSDLNQALKLKPNDVASLRLRGGIHIANNALDAAGKDFDAALQASPGDDELRLSFAASFASARHYDRAVGQYDRWMAEHPKQTGAWEVLNGRCWARAMWNHDLDKALADCDAAVKKGQRNSDVMDSRGMVQLRLGHYRQAVADYDVALARQSKSAWSYLGRGLAKEHLGDAPGAQADIKQAVSLDPDVAEGARRIGLESALLPKADTPAGAPKS